MSEIIVFPAYELLKKDIERLRTELSMLMLEYDELRLVECKNIETAYMLALGGLVYRVYELECIYLRLKRKLELIQALKNRQEKVIMINIELTLDEEFEEYKKKLDEQMNKMNEAIHRSKLEHLSESDTKELKKLYRQIVKALHPDLHPDATQAQIQLFCNATEALENGDLARMQLIAAMVSDTDLMEYKENPIMQLTEEKERLLKVLSTLKERIQNIKTSFPYNVKALLEDEKKLAAKKAELNSLITQYEEAIRIYSARIEEMMK